MYLPSIDASRPAHQLVFIPHGDAAFVSSKLAPANIPTRNSRPIAFNVGTLKSAKDVSPEWNNVLSKVLSDTFVGVGAISAKKQVLVIEPDVAAIKAGAIAGGKAFDDMIVRGLAPQLTK